MKSALRQAIQDLPVSSIREIANAGMGQPGVLAFWFGESDQTTPEVVVEAARKSLADGETFYAHNLGLPALREAIATYTSERHRPVGMDRIAVTSAGVNALMLAVQAVVSPGDEVVVVVPVWPNLVAQPRIMGAQVRTVSLRPDAAGAWRLDLNELLSAVSARTRLLVVNSPNNPTGWTLTRDEQAAILAHCRQTGTVILADEVYERLYYRGATPDEAAPSFLDIAEPDDALMVAHSFSKSFLMTGWRLGWLVLPRGWVDVVGKLIEFNTSCASVFVQRGALAALAHRNELVPPIVAHLRHCRATLHDALQGIEGLRTTAADGGMYAWLQLPAAAGRPADGRAQALRLVAEARLGLAPGGAFADESAQWLRWCFASRDPARLVDGVARLKNWLALH